MPSLDREESRDRELVLKHQPSFSDSGRASVPMWDSSDPDRAPPPLPLNPGSSSPATKPNTSATIIAAAEALTAKARESAYTTNPLPNRSPERSLIKGQYHKRMQSLQNGHGNSQDRSSYLDGSSSVERSPERIPRTPALDYANRSPEKSPTRTGTPTPVAKDFARDTPSLRPTSRPPLKAILGENTPPSTMLALQNISTPKDTDTSLTNITNNSSAMVRNPQTFDAISSQILSLTSIATNLQREMAQLSRRSKDNATDLISLKEATNLRDEDIRTSLRDLVSNLSSNLSIEPGGDGRSRSTSHYSRGAANFMLDSKPNVSPSGIPKSFSLPRIPSQNSFAALDREIVGSPYNVEGAASIALLEKVLREMGTKEGQERLLSSLSELHDRSKSKDSDPAVAKKLEEILTFLKEGSNGKVVVARGDGGNGIGDGPPKLEFEFEPRSMSLARISRESDPQSGRDINVDGRSAASGGFASDEMLKMLKKMKDSIIEGGGMTAELKALVRELRGEVLGMGREIGRKLDQAAEEDVGTLEALLQEVCAGVEEIRERVLNDDDTGDRVHKSDIEVLENLCIDTKSRIEELVLPDVETLPTKVEIEVLGELIRGFADRREEDAELRGEFLGMGREIGKKLDQAAKEDVGTLEALLQEVCAGVEEIRGRVLNDDTGDRVHKSDIEVLENLCIDTKSRIGELVLPDVETLPTKVEIEVLGELIRGFADRREEDAELRDEVLGMGREIGRKLDQAAKENIGTLEALLQEVCAGVEEIRGRVLNDDSSGDRVHKSDIEVLENLCMDTKSRIEELVLPDVETMPTKVEIEVLGDLIRGFADRREEDAELTARASEARKIELGGITDKIQDVKLFSDVEEIRERVLNDDIGDRVHKSDIELLENLCMDTKSHIEELVLPDVETLPTKVEIEVLGDLIRSFADRSQEDAEMTARAFEARKIEHGGIADNIQDVKLFLDEVRGELRAKLDEDSYSIQELAKTLETFTETVVGADAIPYVNELKEIVSREFESVHGAFAGSELEREQKHNNLLEKHDEHKAAIISELHSKIDERFDEIRERVLNDDTGDRIHKSDIELLENLCMDTKSHIEELVLPDVETLPTKVEIEVLGDLIRGFADRREEDAELTARAFESRKIEHGGIADKIQDVKLFLDDVRDELKTKLDEDSYSIQELAKTLETFTETMAGTDAIPLVNELKEVVSREFESVHGAFAGSELEREQKHNNLLEKHDEHKAAIISDLHSKIDERFDEIMTKYDDAQIAAEEKEKAFQEMSLQQIESLNSTQSIAEDLRTLVDTLGSTVTDSCDRMGEDSKTVYERIEDIGSKLEGLRAVDVESEHQSTRAEISKTLTGVEGVQAHVLEYQPKILEAVKEVLGIVGQHYEQAKTSTEEIKTSVKAIPAAIPLPAITAPPPTPPIPIEFPVHDDYDDSAVHAKLDKLVDHAAQAGKSLAQFALLDQIREQVTTTANEFSTFVAQQQATSTKAADDRAKEAEEIAAALQMRISQKENVEADIMRMSAQKDELNNEVQELVHDKEDLIAQKSKMQADLSSLQTALQIRREELQIMENRAEGLERRILDGVLDHARSLLTTSRPPSSLKEMNLKRVVSTASNTTTATRVSTVGPIAPSYTSSAVSSGIGMALKRRQPTKSAVSSSISGKGDRRILSLSTLSANKGPNAERSTVLANSANADNTAKISALGIGGIKRSHSVKSNFPVRKTSWGGTKALGMYADEGIDDEDDKENSVLDEEDEDTDGAAGSEAGTERRTSYSGTYTGTMSYGDGSVVSADDRRTSYAPSTVGIVGTKDITPTEDGSDDSKSESIDEEGDAGQEGRDRDYGVHVDALAPKGGISNASEMVVFGQASDSGIGTEMPTAALEAGTDYFGRRE